MGKPNLLNVNYRVSVKDTRCVPREVKHLSTWRNRKKAHVCENILLVAASEKGRAQTELAFVGSGL